MIELAKHIETLLLENDCVIVPGLGGFIAHYCPSSYNRETREFCPPARTVGFNPKVVMNDGLLVQSYMQAYNTDFPDATRKIEKAVAELKEILYKGGCVYLKNVGTLCYNIQGGYEFEPAIGGFLTPFLYGLETFSPQKLTFKPSFVPLHPVRKERMRRRWFPADRRKRIFRYGIRNAAAVAATVLLFFLFSVPVKNTYIDEASYAALGSAGLFDAIRNQSAASSVISSLPQPDRQVDEKPRTEKQTVKNNVNTLKPTVVKTEKVANVQEEKADTPAKETVGSGQAGKQESPTPAVSVPASSKGNNYIIVASLTNSADAEKMVKNLKQKGYAEAQVVESQGRYRIALSGYASKEDAYNRVNELKKQAEFASAWVFTSK